jgi:type VI secretion system secreted protein Hcp
MAVDMFLKLDGVTGESKDAAHTDEIDVLAWSWGLSQSGTTHSGGGGGAGKANVQDLSITKWVDNATPTLMQFLLQGHHTAKGKLTIRKAGGDAPLEYITLDLEEIIVTSVSTGGSGGEDRLTENISLNFRKFTFTYSKQSDTGGQAKQVPVSWDIAANKAV